MVELVLRSLVVLFVWADVLTTYMFLKKAKDFGYPRWSCEETSPVYRGLIEKHGLVRGLLFVAVINPVVFLLFTGLLSHTLTMVVGRDLGLGLAYGIFYGLFLMSVQRNYNVYYKCPADRYNEKVLGKPLK